MERKAAKLFLGWTEDKEKVYAEIHLEPMYQSHQTEPYVRESITHEPIPRDAICISVTHNVTDQFGQDISFGCGTEDFMEVVRPAKGLTLGDIHNLAKLAEYWHLNSMRAGCAHQTVVYEKDRYGRMTPSLDKTPRCSETGYSYGRAWLGEIAPPNVIAKFEGYIAKGKPIPTHNF